MKFILGYIKGSRSPFDPSRPVVYTRVRANHDGKDYYFDRLVMRDGVLDLPARLQVYDSDEYPPEVVKALLDTGQILEWRGVG